ncbi:MAG: DUF2783 domain-containing protein [Gammaproteobacteria bacterium]|nr:DUF2783 domain-containing protein [Gammaproteobacteria bacterium]
MLNLDYNFADQHDQLYNELLLLHDGLDADQSQALNARLILILMNHIGDADVLREAFKAAQL